MNIFNSTLDIDTNDKEKINRIIQKIMKCPSIVYLKKKDSSSKGVHIILGCKMMCDICRFCYDDYKRFAFDQHKPLWAQNILFNKKEPLSDFYDKRKSDM